jgi:hypothetical protein
MVILIGIIVLILEYFAIWEYGYKKTRAQWKHWGMEPNWRTAVHFSIITCAIATVFSPLYLESIGTSGYQLIDKKTGEHVGTIPERPWIIGQHTWNKLTKNNYYVSSSDFCIQWSRNLNYWISMGSNNWCVVYFGGMDTNEAQLENRITGLGPLLQEHRRAGNFIVGALIEHHLTNGTAIEIVRKALAEPLSEMRDLTIAEKSTLFRQLAPFDNNLWDYYGIRIIDIQCRQ